MNKKAQIDQILEWVIRLIFLTIVTTVIFLILSSHFSSGLNTHYIENVILTRRLIYSPNLLAYQDPITSRVYPGIVDETKFNTQILDSKLVYEEKRIAAVLELTNLETNETLKVYVNEERARAWDDYINIGGYDKSTLKRYVKIHNNGKFYQGILKMKVVTKQ